MKAFAHQDVALHGSLEATVNIALVSHDVKIPGNALHHAAPRDKLNGDESKHRGRRRQRKTSQVTLKPHTV